METTTVLQLQFATLRPAEKRHAGMIRHDQAPKAASNTQTDGCDLSPAPPIQKVHQTTCLLNESLLFRPMLYQFEHIRYKLMAKKETDCAYECATAHGTVRDW